MSHIDVPEIESFLRALALERARPARTPVLRHLLGCPRCQVLVQTAAGRMERPVRLPLYPDTGCPKDVELGQLCPERCGVIRGGRIGHLMGCLWCMLAFHDFLATGEGLAVNDRYEATKAECKRVMRAATAHQGLGPQPTETYLRG